MNRRSLTVVAGVLAFFAIAAPVLAQADVALAAPGDPVATLTVPSTIIEGTGGSTFLSAQVTLDIPAPTSLSFTIATTDGTASSTGSSDFTAQTVGVTFLAGATGPTTINIPITADDFDEGDETLIISLTPISGGLDFAGTPATVTILDDDAPMVATLVVASTVTEGTGGSNFLSAQITLSRTSSLSTFVQLTTSDGSASSSGASDFTAQTVGVTFLAGATGPTTINIPITTDDFDEADETFFISLINPSAGVTIAGSPATVTILDDDAPMVATLVVASTVTEGTGGSKFLSAQITLSRTSSVSTFVQLTTSDGSASSSGASDFTAQTVGVTFLAGATGPTTINIPITTDDFDEADETFFISLINPSAGVTIAGSPATVTILDDDIPLVATLDVATSVVEGTGGTNFLPARITLNRTFSQPVVVTLATSDGSAGSAGAADYAGQTVTVTFLAGALGPSTTLIPITTDSDDEGDETFVTTLTSLSPALTVASSPTTTTIIDDDGTTEPLRSAQTLAATGVVPGPSAGFAGALILLGAALLVAARLRREIFG